MSAVLQRTNHTANARRVRLVPIARPSGTAVADPREHATGFGGAAAGSYLQPQLELEFRARKTPSAKPAMGNRPALHLVRADKAPPMTSDEVADFFDRQPTCDADLPDPRRWATRLAQAVVEVRSGSRPLHQLLRWTTMDVFESLMADLQGSGSEPKPTGSISSVRVARPADGVAEVSAVVTGQQRSRALVLRLEGWDGRWLCTTLAVL